MLRWDNLKLDAEAAPDRPAPLAAALFERGAVTRRLDTPGFRGITFYEIQARSVINKVPAASRVPFRWTINPYRGCSHGCTYCAWGETPILMGDGRVKPLSGVRAGDAVYGTVRRGSCRRYVISRVLAHWPAFKAAYRITLQDGTSLIASGDHRFLTSRGWRHVTGAEHGADRRPHLTLRDSLIGTGAFAEPPKDGTGYRRGYLCGLLRDGRPGHVGLPPGDSEATRRAAGYLTDFGAPAATAGLDMARPPDAPCEDWCKGYLAAVFDARGSRRCGILRICGAGPEVLTLITASLERLGFGYAAGDMGPADVWLTGGLRETLRFLHTVNPAVAEKKSIEGEAVKADATLRIAAIEPLGIGLPMYDITTGTGDFIANGVVSHNCFTRNTHSYLDLDTGLDFESKIVVKVNAPELARKELASPRWQGEHVAMGTNVDCYQRGEGRYRLMPGIISALRDAANPFSILTKGTLILRDLGLLLDAAQVTDVGLNVSVGFVDNELWRLAEGGAPSPRRRLEVCAALTDSGLACGVLMAPIIPFLSDSPSQLAGTVREIAAAGARHVSPIVLHLRPGAREWFGAWLRAHHPRLLPAYRDLYGNGSYAKKSYQQRIGEQVREFARRYGVGRARPGSARVAAIRPGRAPVPRARPASADAAGQYVQLSLLDSHFP